MNGRIGTLQWPPSWEAPRRGRWLFTLRNGRTVAVRSSNLELLEEWMGHGRPLAETPPGFSREEDSDSEGSQPCDQTLMDRRAEAREFTWFTGDVEDGEEIGDDDFAFAD